MAKYAFITGLLALCAIMALLTRFNAALGGK